MLEGGAQEVGEDVIIEAVEFGLDALRPVLELQDRMCAAVGRQKRPVEEISYNGELARKLADLAEKDLAAAYRIPAKLERYAKLDAARAAALSAVTAEDPASEQAVRGALDQLERKILREMILNEGTRIDGRSAADIRPISCEAGLLPRTHGSALFTRGETQALAVRHARNGIR